METMPVSARPRAASIPTSRRLPPAAAAASVASSEVVPSGAPARVVAHGVVSAGTAPDTEAGRRSLTRADPADRSPRPRRAPGVGAGSGQTVMGVLHRLTPTAHRDHGVRMRSQRRAPRALRGETPHLLSIRWPPGGHRRVADWGCASTMPVPGQSPPGGARLRPSWSWTGCHGEPDCGGSPQGAGTPRPHRTSGSVHWSRRQQGYEQAKAPFIPRTLGVTVGLLAAGGVSTTEEY